MFIEWQSRYLRMQMVINGICIFWRVMHIREWLMRRIWTVKTETGILSCNKCLQIGVVPDEGEHTLSFTRFCQLVRDYYHKFKINDWKDYIINGISVEASTDSLPLLCKSPVFCWKISIHSARTNYLPFNSRPRLAGKESQVF